MGENGAVVAFLLKAAGTPPSWVCREWDVATHACRAYPDSLDSEPTEVRLGGDTAKPETAYRRHKNESRVIFFPLSESWY
ncbi:hypothetical protein LX36DRAFT_652432 [Colletotrichum falcatum]|nr:hypothetical protein LX36DRAFT_652432 [Colletotrichum falcatum]